MTFLDFQLAGFLGRFHPVIVHLPIGFLLIGGLMEYIARKRKINLDTAISLILFSGALAALLTAGLGWLLASNGGYQEDTLFWHRWLGVGVALFATVVWLAKIGKLPAEGSVYKFLLVTLVILIAITGHLGGNLTHGSNYLLEYAPAGLSELLGGSGQQKLALASDPDSVLVFDHVIQPILNHRCVQCHNGDKMKGDLNMEHQQGILAGGDNGEIIQAGAALESEIFKRVTLPPDHKKFMPAQGKTPLTYSEIKLIEWWINAGADFGASVIKTGVTPDIKFVLAQLYGLDTDPKSYVERATVSPASPQHLEQLQAAGFYAQPIAADNNFIEVKKKKTTDIEKQSLQLIENVKEQVTWLHLSGADLADGDLEFLSGLSNLTMLRLDNNPITDAGLKSLQGLQHLESLNLYGTEVTGGVVESLKSLPALKKVFLWQTNITPEEVEQIQSALPDLEIDAGFALSNN